MTQQEHGRDAFLALLAAASARPPSLPPYWAVKSCKLTSRKDVVPIAEVEEVRT